jgi:ribosomal protein L21E
MPYFKRPTALARCLENLALFYPGSEVSICDDGSGDAHAIAQRFTGEIGVVVTELDRKDHALNPCLPMNVAVESANGEILVLTNPEVWHVDPIIAVLTFGIDEASYVAAACFDTTTQRWLCKRGVRNGQLPVPAGAGFHFCAALRRELWDKAGGFDEEYRDGQACEDTDFLWRLHAAGARFEIRDECVV